MQQGCKECCFSENPRTALRSPEGFTPGLITCNYSKAFYKRLILEVPAGPNKNDLTVTSHLVLNRGG